MSNEELPASSGSEGEKNLHRNGSEPLTEEEVSALRELYKVGTDSKLNISEEKAAMAVDSLLSNTNSIDIGLEFGTGPIPGDAELMSRVEMAIINGKDISPEDMEAYQAAFFRDTTVASVLTGIDYASEVPPEMTAKEIAQYEEEYEANRAAYEKAMRLAGRTDEGKIDPMVDKAMERIRASQAVENIVRKFNGGAEE